MPAPFTLQGSAAPMESAFLAWGIHVVRAAATLPQSTTANIFTISGGRVFINAILGQVTTVIQTQANSTKLTATPTIGSATDLCTGTSITAAAVGAFLSLPAAAGSALVMTAGGFAYMNFPGLALDVGSITLACAASNTGAIKWDLWYSALDPLGRVVPTAIGVGGGP
jgi:hypothetical protein